jgi:Tfp pilus assembly protein PilF
MSRIRAFVGHSFVENDADVVRKFLTYFDQLSKSDLDFSWEHAEAAEPRVLAEKVISLLNDKNVFVGICTKKERAIPPTSLSKSALRTGVLKAHEREFEWKTSDWIIQEIGLAIGHKLDLVLLVENGVRQPGGLQSNVEYIEFERDSPEKSFGKIVEMISALSPATSSPSATSSDAKSIPGDEEREHESPGGSDWATPKADWKRRDYEQTYWRMTVTGDTAGTANIDKAYLATEDAADTENRISWEAFAELTRLWWAKGGSLAKLKELAEANPENIQTLQYMARGYEKYQDHTKAANTYETAARKAVDTKEFLRLMGRAAVGYVRAELRENSSAIIRQMKARVESDGNGELEILRALRGLSKLEKEDNENLAIMERIVEVDPSDVDTRFSLAYKHSECGNNDLALYHYLKIPTLDRSSTTWNNLGVTFDQFSLPAKSVESYRRAEKLDGTLAMSNLAQKFISEGFLPEAKKQCDDALMIEDYHKNIESTLARLKELPDKENEKEAELLEKAKPKSDFYKQFGRAVSRADPNELTGRWEGPDCVLDVKSRDEEFRTAGTYERHSSGLLGLYASGVGGSTSSDNTPVRFRVEYSGTLRGRAIEARVTRKQEGAMPIASTLLGSSTDETRVLMFVTSHENELRVMETSPGNGSRFYSLRRQVTTS